MCVCVCVCVCVFNYKHMSYAKTSSTHMKHVTHIPTCSRIRSCIWVKHVQPSQGPLLEHGLEHRLRVHMVNLIRWLGTYKREKTLRVNRMFSSQNQMPRTSVWMRVRNLMLLLPLLSNACPTSCMHHALVLYLSVVEKIQRSQHENIVRHSARNQRCAVASSFFACFWGECPSSVMVCFRVYPQPPAWASVLALKTLL